MALGGARKMSKPDAAQIWIRQNRTAVQGPFAPAKVEGWLRQGRVRAGMEMSFDGTEWLTLTEDAIRDMLAASGAERHAPADSTGVSARRRTSWATPARAPLTKQQQNALGCLGLVGVLLVFAFVGKLFGCGEAQVAVSGKEATATVELGVPLLMKSYTTTDKIAQVIYDTAKSHADVEVVKITLVVDKDDLTDGYGNHPNDDVRVALEYGKEHLSEARRFADRATYREKMEAMIALPLIVANQALAKVLLDG